MSHDFGTEAFIFGRLLKRDSTQRKKDTRKISGMVGGRGKNVEMNWRGKTARWIGDPMTNTSFWRHRDDVATHSLLLLLICSLFESVNDKQSPPYDP